MLPGFVGSCVRTSGSYLFGKIQCVVICDEEI